MKCDDVRDRLDRGGEPAAAAPALDAHLRTCGACREHAADLRVIASRLAELPAEIPPARDLWPGIAVRLGREKSVARPLPWARLLLAAAGLAAAFGLGLVAGRGGPVSAPLDPTGVSPAASLPSAVPASSAALAERSLATSRTRLLDELERVRPALDPEVAAVVDQNLRFIDDALAEIRTALANSPLDVNLNIRQASLERRRLELVGRAIRLAST